MPDTQHPGGSDPALDTPHGASLTIDEVFDRRMARQEQATAAEAATPPDAAADQGGGDEEAGNTLDAQDSAAVDEAEPDQPDEADPDETSDDEADEASEDEAERLYTVVIDGKEEVVPASELVKGYQRNAVFTRKSQALAEEKRATEEQQRRLQTEAQQITEAQRYYTEASKRYEQLVEALGSQVQDEGKTWQNVDWDRLEADDPLEFARQSAKYQRFRDKQHAVQAEKQRLAAEQANERQQAVAKAQDNLRQSLTTMFPQWADETVRAREIRQMNAYTAKIGIPESALATEYNPAVWKLIFDAAQADALRSTVQQAKHKPAPAKAATPSGTAQAATPQPIRLLRPDAARPNPVRTARATEVSALAARARKTGNIDDVWALREARQANKPR